MSRSHAQLLASKPRAALHVVLALLGSRCYQLAAEIRTEGATAGFRWRVDQVRDELMLAAEELGHCLDDLKAERADKHEVRRVEVKVRRIARELEQEARRASKQSRAGSTSVPTRSNRIVVAKERKQ